MRFIIKEMAFYTAPAIGKKAVRPPSYSVRGLLRSERPMAPGGKAEAQKYLLAAAAI